MDSIIEPDCILRKCRNFEKSVNLICESRGYNKDKCNRIRRTKAISTKPRKVLQLHPSTGNIQSLTFQISKIVDNFDSLKFIKEMERKQFFSFRCPSEHSSELYKKEMSILYFEEYLSPKAFVDLCSHLK